MNIRHILFLLMVMASANAHVASSEGRFKEVGEVEKAFQQLSAYAPAQRERHYQPLLKHVQEFLSNFEEEEDSKYNLNDIESEIQKKKEEIEKAQKNKVRRGKELEKREKELKEKALEWPKRAEEKAIELSDKIAQLSKEISAFESKKNTTRSTLVQAALPAIERSKAELSQYERELKRLQTMMPEAQKEEMWQPKGVESFALSQMRQELETLKEKVRKEEQDWGRASSKLVAQIPLLTAKIDKTVKEENQRYKEDAASLQKQFKAQKKEEQRRWKKALKKAGESFVQVGAQSWSLKERIEYLQEKIESAERNIQKLNASLIIMENKLNKKIEDKAKSKKEMQMRIKNAIDVFKGKDENSDRFMRSINTMLSRLQ